MYDVFLLALKDHNFKIHQIDAIYPMLFLTTPAVQLKARIIEHLATDVPYKSFKFFVIIRRRELFLHRSAFT